MKLKFNVVIMLMAICAMPMFGQGGQGGQRGQGQGQGQDGGQRGQGQRQMTEEGVTERVKQLSKTLELSEVQEKNLIDYEVASYKKNQVERQKLSGDREAMRDFMMKSRELRNEKYEEVLNAEQLKKYKEIEEQRMQNRQQRNPNQRPGEQGDRPSRGRGR